MIRRYYTAVYVPHNLMLRVAEHRSALTKAAGGCTITEARGEWFNDKGEIIRDHINVCTWWHERSGLDYDPLVDALLDSGEATVMVEMMVHGQGPTVYIFDKRAY